MGFDWRWIVLGLIVFAIFKLFETRCPQCRRFLAMTRTGKEEREVNLVTTKHNQYRCSHCGYEKWWANNSQ